jgi:hypothetical protein
VVSALALGSFDGAEGAPEEVVHALAHAVEVDGCSPRSREQRIDAVSVAIQPLLQHAKPV